MRALLSALSFLAPNAGIDLAANVARGHGMARMYGRSRCRVRMPKGARKRHNPAGTKLARMAVEGRIGRR